MAQDPKRRGNSCSVERGSSSRAKLGGQADCFPPRPLVLECVPVVCRAQDPQNAVGRFLNGDLVTAMGSPAQNTKPRKVVSLDSEPIHCSAPSNFQAFTIGSSHIPVMPLLQGRTTSATGRTWLASPLCPTNPTSISNPLQHSRGLIAVEILHRAETTEPCSS